MPQTQGAGTVYTGGPGSSLRLPLYGKFGPVTGSQPAAPQALFDINGNPAWPGAIKFASVPVTPAQVKAMFATPIPLVPAQGAGTFIELVSAVINLSFGTTAYTVSGSAIYLLSTGLVVWTSLSGDFKSQFASFLAASATSLMVTGPDQTAGLGSAGDGPGPTQYTNVPLTLANDANHDATLGDSSLLIDVAYRVHTGIV